MTACPKTPPAKHRRTGAVLRSDYAYPECWKYPIHTPENTRSAAAYFARFKNKVPAAQRSKVAARIEAAKRRFGIGPYRENPDEAMMSKKDAKIRGHQMALKNAQKRGDKAGVAKQHAALAKLGGKPMSATKSVTRHKGKANPSHRKTSMRGGKRYRHNPDVDTSDIDKGWDPEATLPSNTEIEALTVATEKLADATKVAKETAAVAKEATKEAKKNGGTEARKEAAAAKKQAVAAEKKVEKLEEKIDHAIKKIEKKAPRSRGGSKKTMAKKTKAERSAAAKKGAAKRKRNEKKATAAPASSKAPRRKRAKSPKAKAARRRRIARKRSSHFPRVPKAFRRVKSKVSVVAKNRKTGKRKTFSKTRTYKSNPMSDLGMLAVMGGGVFVGAILSDLLRRYVVTMAPKGGKEPYYGNLASERIDSARPTGAAYAAQGILGVAGLGLAYAVRRKSPGAAGFLAGLGLGALGQVVLEIFEFGIAPALMPSKDINDKNTGNRLYPLQQTHSQDYVANVIKTEDTAVGAGAVYKPDGTGVAGLPGGSGLGYIPPRHGQTAVRTFRPCPQGQYWSDRAEMCVNQFASNVAGHGETRQLPPAQGNAFRPAAQNTRGGQVAGIPQQQTQAANGQVGCGGAGGCGGGGYPGCTGGRNCSCAKCQGIETVAPAADMQATTATSPARNGNVNGPRQLSAASVVPFAPRNNGARNPMAAFGGRLPPFRGGVGGEVFGLSHLNRCPRVRPGFFSSPLVGSHKPTPKPQSIQDGTFQQAADEPWHRRKRRRTRRHVDVVHSHRALLAQRVQSPSQRG